MFKKLFLLTICMSSIIGLFAIQYDWGFKFGAGSSSLCGSDLNYKLHYDFYTVDTATADFGYLDVDSKKVKGKTSYSGGLYFVSPMLKDKDAILLQTEVLWQRYNFSYHFGKRPESNLNLLSAAFSDTLTGSIDKTVDYLTVPVLMKLQQIITNPTEHKNYNGAFIYFGPSFAFRMNSKTSMKNDLATLDDKVNGFVASSYTDPDTLQYYTFRRVQSASDKLKAYKVDFIFGAGFNIKDIFKLGFGKDEFVIDVRFDIGVNPIGDTASKKDIKLYSTIVSIGCKF